MDITERILMIRGDKTREQFTEGTNTSAQTLYKYEKRTGKPTIEFVDQVCKKFKVNYAWLISGEGPIFSDSPPQPTNPQVPYRAEQPHLAGTCLRCAELKEELEKEREERRELSAENRHLNAEIRQLTKENGELRTEVAVQREQLKSFSGRSVVADCA